MELRQLRYFVAVAEELHFGRAAAKLHMSQPPLSSQVRRLEQQLGVELLRRSTRRVTLTPAGEHFYRRAVAVLAELDAAVDETRETDAGVRGRLAIGFVSSANITVLPGAIRHFCSQRPAVELTLRPLTTSEQIDALHEGSIEIGLVRAPGPGNGLRLEAVLSEALIAVIPVEHLLAGRDSVGVGDLADEPIVLFPYHLMPGFVGTVLKMFDDAGATPMVVQRAVHHETALGLVAAGVGLAILPESSARIATPDVRCVPIQSSPRLELSLAHIPSALSPAGEEFVRCIRIAAAAESQCP